jgi:hypothetical protein
VESAATKTALSPEEARNRLVRWVVLNDLPFSAVESADFRSLVRPDIVVPSADTIKRDIMDRYHSEASRIGDQLRNAGSKISITLDCWTTPNTRDFLGITGHYIDGDWAPQSPLLDLVPLDGSHSGEDLCGALVATCDRFGILDKLLGITTDNASNNNTLLACLERVCHDRGIVFDKDEQHVRCAAHVVNLAAQALLRSLGTDASDASDGESGLDSGPDSDAVMQAEKLPCIANLRRLVVKVRSSTQRRSDFKYQCGVCDIPEKQLILDTPTRWNFTHARYHPSLHVSEQLAVMLAFSSAWFPLADFNTCLIIPCVNVAGSLVMALSTKVGVRAMTETAGRLAEAGVALDSGLIGVV